MKDLTRTLTQLSERGMPQGSAWLREHVMLELATHSRAVSSRSNHWKPAWAFLVAAALVLLAIGLVPLLLLDSEGDTPVEPAVGETPALDTGWERIAPDLSGMLAVSPDLGMVIVHLNEPEVGVRAWHSPDGQIWTEATGIGATRTFSSPTSWPWIPGSYLSVTTCTKAAVSPGCPKTGCTGRR